MEVNSEVDTTDSELNGESYEHLTSLLALFILEPENFKFGGCTHSKVAPFMESCGHIRWRNQRTLKLEVVPIPRWVPSWSPEPENSEVGGCTHSKVAPFMEPCGHIRWRNQRTLKLEVVPIPRWLLSWSPVAT
ncbi:unnamed protein product [Orchesella dallaii]|uniref:Uncharacterized protein n=1 Tax=Orchesella dallaii TaxID=48710 RepID=A0ABP1PZL7_9HEXA